MELSHAEMVLGMCQQYGVLPVSGGLMEQPVWFLTMHAVLAAAGETPAPPPPDPLAGLPYEIGDS